MRNYLSPLLMLAVLLTCAEVFPQTLELSFVPASVRVRQEGVLPAAVPARIACARNEYESFQVVVTPRDGMLRRGAAQLEPFRDAGRTGGRGLGGDSNHLNGYPALRNSVERRVPALTPSSGLRLLPWGLLSNPPASHVCPKGSLKAEDGLEAGTEWGGSIDIQRCETQWNAGYQL